MATPLLDAITANIAGEMNSDKKTERKLVDQHVKMTDQDLVERKLENLDLIANKVASFDDTTPASTRHAYERLYDQVLNDKA